MTGSDIYDKDMEHRRKGVYVAKAAIIGFFAFFVVAILGTAAITYCLSNDDYYFNILHLKGEISKPDLSQIQEINKLSLPPVHEGEPFRLPTALIPKKYKLELQPFLDADVHNFSVTGYEEMIFQAVENTNQIIFHVVDIIIDTSSLELSFSFNGSSTGLQFTDFTEDKSLQFFIITVDGNFSIGSDYMLKINFTGYLNDNLVGFYRSSYTDVNDTEHLLATTQMEPLDARRAFPCFDEPALKAVFEICIMRKGLEMRSLSNMIRQSVTAESGEWDGWYWDIFKMSPPMSTYLVAFVISDFVFLTGNENDTVLFRVWAREEAIDQAEYAMSVGPEILKFFEVYFNVTYPLEKCDMVALPDFDAGAMENWGLITYRETAVLYDPVMGSASNKERVGGVVAHELAHMWFGDIVSPSWWTYLWLNEGFATYMTYIGLDAVEPTFDMLDQFVRDDLQYVFAIDSLETSHPITIEVTDPSQINEIFDAISYSKGASIIRMMEHFLTTSTFRKALTNYLTDLSYQSATADDLWFYMTEQGHDDATLPLELTVKGIMDTWTLQMGYPVLNVTRSSDGSTASVIQNRFLLVANASADYSSYLWWIPLNYASQNNPDFSNTFPNTWMRKIDKEIILNTQTTKSQWLILNIQQTSYYRVNYDEHNWGLIVQQLMDDLEVIALANRAQIVDDSLDLARAGLLSYDIALNVTAYLEKEEHYIPWRSALDNLDYLEEMFTATSTYGAMKNYLLTLLLPLYTLVGFEDNLTDPHLDQLKRSMALSWVCFLEDKDCVGNATALYQQWMITEDPLIISPNLKSTVYCTGIGEGNEAEWNFAYEMFLASNLGSEQSYLLYAMGCTKEQWLLARYLDMGFTEEYGIRKQDSYKVFNSVAGNDIGNRIAWDYLVANWDDLAAYYGSPSSCSSYASTASREFNTIEELAELTALRDEHLSELGGATQTLDQAIERVNNNIYWVGNYSQQIHDWLQDEGYGSSVGP